MKTAPPIPKQMLLHEYRILAASRRCKTAHGWTRVRLRTPDGRMLKFAEVRVGDSGDMMVSADKSFAPKYASRIARVEIVRFEGSRRYRNAAPRKDLLEEIKVDKKIPIPEMKRATIIMEEQWAALLLRMKPGDSFLLPGNPVTHYSYRATCCRAAINLNINLITRATSEGIRIWLTS